MGENEIIKPHTFEDAQKNLKEFLDRTSPDLGIDKVRGFTPSKEKLAPSICCLCTG